MAANTDPRLQNQVIYSIYVRNHTRRGHLPRRHSRPRPHPCAGDGYHLADAHSPHRRRGQKKGTLPFSMPTLSRRVSRNFET